MGDKSKARKLMWVKVQVVGKVDHCGQAGKKADYFAKFLKFDNFTSSEYACSQVNL